MKRLVGGLSGLYVLLALGSKVAESKGAMLCACSEDCWCRRPGLSVFRWVFPRGHRGVHDAHDKAPADAG